MGFINCFICKHYILKYDPLNRVVSEKKKKKNVLAEKNFPTKLGERKYGMLYAYIFLTLGIC